jgi:transcriptional regulator
MYCPAVFREQSTHVLHAFIRSHPLGLLISHGSTGLIANLVPFVLRTGDGGRDVLQAHVARANPQWRELDGQPVLVVFRGPDAYVSPSMYATKLETGKVVPTWNYAMVQARGMVRIREQAEWLAGQLQRLTTGLESSRRVPWSISDAPGDYIESQMKHIVGIELEIVALDGKWKVSQNQPEANRRSVVAGFSQDDSNPEMAELVSRYGGL